MTQSILCHLLIGLPGSGKSTFALELQKQIPNSVIVSTDSIRHQLFGDEAIQGDWKQIEQQVIERVRNNVSRGFPVIYDATNVKREWRASFLEKVGEVNAEWIAWWIKTPVNVCKQWNKKRSRQVPDKVIDIYGEYLELKKPTIEEGFVAIRETNLV